MERAEFRTYQLQDLKDFGIGHLTGESCAIGLRILYDLTWQGVEHIESALCIKLDNDSPANWNSRVGNIKAIKSIKLSHDQAYHVLVCILASKFETVVEFTPIDKNDRGMNRILLAGNKAGYDSYFDSYINDEYSFVRERYHMRLYCQPAQDTQPHSGLDNTHGFSGRTT